MKQTEVHYPDDGEWTEEDVKKFVRDAEKEDYDIETGGDGGDDEVTVHPGTVVVGIVIFFIIVYSIYIGELRFAGLNCILLVALALGSKAID